MTLLLLVDFSNSGEYTDLDESMYRTGVFQNCLEFTHRLFLGFLLKNFKDVMQESSFPVSFFLSYLCQLWRLWSEEEEEQEAVVVEEVIDEEDNDSESWTRCPLLKSIPQLVLGADGMLFPPCWNVGKFNNPAMSTRHHKWEQDS